MDYGFKMEAGLATEDPEYKQVMEQRGLRLKDGLGLFSTKELVAPAE
jgi:UDP-N-acetyl-D-mannosaminuronic acid transferase (WecB/TagA/CpsF family)